MRRRHLVGAVLAVSSAVLLAAACSTTLQGTPVSVFADPFRVAGMPATDGPTGLRPDPPEPTRKVKGTDGGDIDELARQAVSDIEEFWNGVYSESFGGEFRRAKALISWDANGFDSIVFCGGDTYGLVNAAFCHDDRTIGWDRGELLPGLQRKYGDMGVTMVLAHEYGHAVQRQAKMAGDATPTLVAEQQADCLAGAYMRWVAEDNSPRFSLSTGDGLNNVLAAVIAFRDPLMSEADPAAGSDEHGSAFERLSAFQFGFTDGASACASIDMREIGQRRGDLPVLLDEDETGEWEVSETSVRTIIAAMDLLFEPANPPVLSFAGADCPGTRPSPPVSFCPSTNTIAVDLDGLTRMGTQDTTGGDELATGDNSAYSVLVSRYMQAVQHEHGGVALDNAEAALRTACLTGVATTKLSKSVTTPDGNTVALTAGDVDEAVSGILTNGLVASDVNGESVPSGFSRIDAFRVGVLGDQDRCFKRFS
ncbi:neutral zinc metallopeptidase [Mycolicibacterium holsaticum]|uniref:neutral zinc metallopeptidase n=1 Tax=Mycolicibacterium holsaticum TaxID=152142 RepID=UPI001C7D402B|nr:neutral zinc metallopeptidase [Mycolicibacterium holsaticum]QZA13989.1 neutral zinc metallopeptidase [Mycolicibacterium holsaticum DSM 44478 = JCM 12374]UNC08551.1 neutral zinc metallopeptidase [Mycolicibacterium holsaticum DSM 44478 = JCM 12374]